MIDEDEYGDSVISFWLGERSLDHRDCLSDESSGYVDINEGSVNCSFLNLLFANRRMIYKGTAMKLACIMADILQSLHRLHYTVDFDFQQMLIINKLQYFL